MIDNEKHIVFYDSECLLCSRTIRFLLKKDSKKNLRFAPLGGITSLSYPTMNSDEFKNTLVFLKKEVFLTESSGVLSILQLLPFPWKLLSVFIFIPPIIRNSVYKIVAKNRYKWFGRKENCLVLGDKYASSMLP